MTSGAFILDKACGCRLQQLPLLVFGWALLLHLTEGCTSLVAALIYLVEVETLINCTPPEMLEPNRILKIQKK